jgi:ribonucleoside-diphosphate reductase alpha chain
LTTDPRKTPDATSSTDTPAAPETTQQARPQGKKGLTIQRFFTEEGKHPFDEISWDIRTSSIGNEKGEMVFEQADVEVPSFWSQTATNIVASKYFRGTLGTPEREQSARQLIGRVVDTLARWGRQGGYFATAADAQAFSDELTHLLIYQKASFNSPVWFNMGIEPHPQCSACFINSVQDTMDSILTLAKTEGMLFKFGSGTGTNLSPIRSSRENLAGGGTASGPVSFMKGFDAFAGVIKSGGKTRRAAKMVVLNIDHPDIEDFINCKVEEERKAWALMDAGFDGSLTGPAYSSVFFQNSNNSVRVTEEFMNAVVEDKEWHTRAIRTGQIMQTYRARDLMKMIAESAHVCGDPGMQWDTTTNEWHTCPNTGRINASNPCVTGDTLVATSDGWQRIDSLVGRTARVIGLDGQPHMVTKIFPTGTKPVFRLKTRAGFELRLTADHKVWTLDRGDVPVSDVKVGERVQLQGPEFGRRALTDRLALAVGVAVGDGCLTRSYTTGRMQEMIILTMAEEEAGVLQSIAGEVNEQKQMLRAVGSVGRPDDVHVRIGTATGSRLAFGSQVVVDLFKELAVLDEGSERKRFTPAAFELDQPSLAALLRGLFTADGTVANYGEKSQYVSLDSTSQELLQQVQLLLLAFGIKSKIYANRRGGATESMLPDGKGNLRPYPVQEFHSLRISRASRIIFEREIGFDPASPKYAALRELNAEFGTYGDELTDEIASIEPLGEEPVFDLTEESTHHFVANGIQVHNCSEYMFLDDSACNLASLNLMKFRREDGEFDPVSFRQAVQIVITAQEIIVGNASYPTPAIGRNSHDYRPLGLGYANLGALLMARGLPYDSDEGRDYAGAITALMTGEAYATSARIAAEVTGPFAGYEKNRTPFLKVMDKHRSYVPKIDSAHVPLDLLQAARESWDEVIDLGEQHGFRNAQATVIAPTGTIGFMMDCDTTGIEPDIALIKYKKLVGGGMIKIVNQTVPEALKRLGYDVKQCQEILEYLEEHDTIEGAPHLQERDLPVFDCAFRPRSGFRSIAYMGHIKMMAAAQPFISGAISKTVNVPSEATPEDITQAYLESWRLGLKALAIYRDGSKRTQPLNTGKGEAVPAKIAALAAAAGPQRHRLPDERHAITHKFEVAGHQGYLTVGMYEDGSPGELFLVMAKEGSTVSGLMDAFATAISMALQYGVPLRVLVDKFAHMRFEPSGFTKNPEIPMAKSIMDYIFRWLGSKFLSAEEKVAIGLIHREEEVPKSEKADEVGDPNPEATRNLGLRLVTSPAVNTSSPNAATYTFQAQDDAPSCHDCGAIMVRSGACYKCLNCGATSGCS